MNWQAIKYDFRWRLKYELFRHVLPRLEYEPFTIRHLSYKAWPKVAAMTSADDYSGGIDFLDWQSADIPDDGSELIHSHASESRPLVIRGYAKDCSLASWSMDDLKLRVGDLPLAVRVGDYLSEFGQPRLITINLSEFVEYLEGERDFPREDLLFEGIGPYVGNQQIPALADQLSYPVWLDSGTDSIDSPIYSHLTTFWLGSADAITPLHCHHFCDTFVIQLIGRRRFMLIPPHEALLVGYVPHNINIGFAAFDPYAPDRAQFPAADDILSFDIDLGPGDALLIPGFWFHTVKLSAPSLSASRFVRSRMPAALGGGPTRPWTEAERFVRGW